MTSTDPETRQASITGLRQLAAYLEAHPDIPVSRYGWDITVIVSDTDDGGREQVDQAADLLDVPVMDDTPGGGNYRTARTFGAITYVITAVSPESMARYEAWKTWDQAWEAEHA